MPKFKKSSGFRMKGYTYPGTAPVMKKENGGVIDKIHGGFEEAADRMNQRVKDSKTIAGGFIHAIGALPANVGEVTTRYIKKGVDAIKKKKKKGQRSLAILPKKTKKNKKITKRFMDAATQMGSEMATERITEKIMKKTRKKK